QVGVKVWDLADDEAKEFKLPEEQDKKRIDALAFSPDGKMLAVGGWSGMVHLWSLGRREGKLQTVCKGLNIFVGSIAFSPNGKKVAAVAFDGRAIVWDTE